MNVDVYWERPDLIVSKPFGTPDETDAKSTSPRRSPVKVICESHGDAAPWRPLINILLWWTPQDTLLKNVSYSWKKAAAEIKACEDLSGNPFSGAFCYVSFLKRRITDIFWAESSVCSCGYRLYRVLFKLCGQASKQQHFSMIASPFFIDFIEAVLWLHKLLFKLSITAKKFICFSSFVSFEAAESVKAALKWPHMVVNVLVGICFDVLALIDG